MPRVCALDGNVGNEPEMKLTVSGQKVTNISLATYAGKDQDKKQLTTWVKVTFWGDMAELVNKQISKGQRVRVWGYCPTINNWQDKDKNEHYDLKMVGFHIGRVPTIDEFEELVPEVSESNHKDRETVKN